MEPEWDDTTRAWVEGLGEYRRSLCPGCGLSSTVVHDPAGHLQMVDDYCPACRALAVYERKVADRDVQWERQHQKAAPGERRPNDGLHLMLRTATPEEIQAHRAIRREPEPDDQQRRIQRQRRVGTRG